MVRCRIIRHLFEANVKQLGALQLSVLPGRAQVSVAAAALMHDDLVGDALGNVMLLLEAVDTHVGLVGLD